MQKAAPVFYSNAERAVDGVKQEKATAEQWLAMIQKQGGLKAGEDKWLGLSDWLKSRSGESLTKREVLDFIRENQIRVEEVAYGDAPVALSEDGQKRFQELKEKFDGWSSEEGSETAWWRLYDEVEKLGVIRQHSADSIAAAAFDVDDDGKLVIIDERAAALLFDDNKKPINSTRLAYTTEGLQNKREIALTVPSVEPWNESDEIHFGDAGGGRAVAWVRFGETRDREGKRVLVIDEIQS